MNRVEIILCSGILYCHQWTLDIVLVCRQEWQLLWFLIPSPINVYRTVLPAPAVPRPCQFYIQSLEPTFMNLSFGHSPSFCIFDESVFTTTSFVQQCAVVYQWVLYLPSLLFYAIFLIPNFPMLADLLLFLWSSKCSQMTHHHSSPALGWNVPVSPRLKYYIAPSLTQINI